MLKIYERKINPENYENLGKLGFLTIFCQDCRYLPSSDNKEEESKRVKTCIDCIPLIDRYFIDKQSIIVTHNEEGKNIVKP